MRYDNNDSVGEFIAEDELRSEGGGGSLYCGILLELGCLDWVVVIFPYLVMEKCRSWSWKYGPTASPCPVMLTQLSW